MLSPTGTNNANFYDTYGTGNGTYTDPINLLTPVGAFASSPSSYGTFDQGGDVSQWTEMKWFGGAQRGAQGGFYRGSSNAMLSASTGSQSPGLNDFTIGFRIVQVPEPASTFVLGMGACLALARRKLKRWKLKR